MSSAVVVEAQVCTWLAPTFGGAPHSERWFYLIACCEALRDPLAAEPRNPMKESLYAPSDVLSSSV